MSHLKLTCSFLAMIPHFDVMIGQIFSRVAELIPRFPATSLLIMDGFIPAILARSDWLMFFLSRKVITSSLIFMQKELLPNGRISQA